ncbi:MAG: DNA polymerase III subunit delta [Myxococcota bacterium]
MATKGAMKGGDPLAHLSSEGPRMVYAIDGEERLLVDEAVATIRDAALKPQARDFNLDVYIAKETPVARVLDAAQTLPAFAPLRVVIAKEAERYTGENADALIDYLSRPSPTTVLILIASEKFDARTKAYKALEKAGATMRFPHPTEREMPKIIEARAKKLGLAIEPEAIRSLVDGVGADVGGMIAALEKLLLYVGPGSGRRVQRADVDEVVMPVKEESIFELSDAVGTRDVSRALGLLSAMLEGARAHPLALLGLLAGHWRRLSTARSILDSGATRDAVQDALPRMPPFVIDKLVQQARKQPLGELVRGLEAIAAADALLKGGALAGPRVMERLVLTLAG